MRRHTLAASVATGLVAILALSACTADSQIAPATSSWARATDLLITDAAAALPV